MRTLPEPTANPSPAGDARRSHVFPNRLVEVSQEEYDARKRYLLLDDNDIALLRDLGRSTETATAGLMDRFFEYLRVFPDFRRLLKDEATMARLKRAQTHYFQQLLSGRYGLDYVQDRVRVGITHHHVGVEPKCYLGAYAYYMRMLLPELWQAAGADWQQALPRLEALIKMVFLDLGLVLDSYRMVDRRQLSLLKKFNKRIVENVPSGLLILDRDLRVVNGNKCFYATCNKAVKDVVGHPVSEVLGIGNLDQHLQQVLDSGLRSTGLMFSARFSRHESYRPVRISASCIMLPDEDDETREEGHLLIIIEDLSEEEQLVAAARESERRFLEVFETAPDGMVMMDKDGSVTYFNQAAENMFGWQREEVIGQPATLLIPEKYWLPHKKLVRRYLKTGRLFMQDTTCIFEGRRRDGSTFPLECTVSVNQICDDVIFTGAVRDITERCQRQAEIEESHTRLQALLEAAPDLVYYLDRDGIVRFANRLLLGFTEKDVLGQSWRAFVRPEHHELMQAAINTVVRTGEAHTLEVCSPNAEGEKRWFSCRLGPALRGGTVVGIVILAQDVTEKKQAETQLAASARMASVGTLAAGVAHEINTPVQFVGDSAHFLRDAIKDLLGVVEHYRGALRAVADGADIADTIAQAEEFEQNADLEYLAEQAPRAVDRSLDGLGRVTAIVRAMKAFAHPQQEEMAPAQLNDALNTTITVARNEYKYVADVETDFGDLPPVKCFLGELNQVFLNIIVNAAHAIGDVVKGTDQRGRITIRTRAEAGWVTVSIADTGGGIPERVRDRIFDMFFTTKEVGKGTGQGLALARATLEKHQGSITFETEIGQGTTFFIRVPIEGNRQETTGHEPETDPIR